jgi:ribonuclease HI
MCVRTVTYSILINGRPYGRIVPSHGLRQGDPLSPFILCAEALSSLIRNSERVGGITGVPISRGGTQIHHLFFVDDSLLFCKANLREWRHIEEILELYEMASGQKINRENTSIFFCKNTSPEAKEEILSVVGADHVQQFERYLGLPALIGRSRVSSFNYIKGRIWAKLNGWKKKFLTHVGKEILLKAVIQAIPTYTMSVFRLPKTLTREINSLMGKFWWSFKENINKIAWMSWKRLGRSKDFGGLGYRDLDCFNMAMLAKQCWRLLKWPDSLAARVLCEKYYPGVDFMESNLRKKPSFAWRSIWQAKSLLQEGLMWRVGNGSRIKLWDDKWIPATPHKVLDPVRILSRDARVADIINQEANWWDIPLIEQIFSGETVEKICSIPISPRSQEDKLIWAGTNNGMFSIRSAYHLEVERRNRDNWSTSSLPFAVPTWRRLWKLNLPRFILLFLWRACNDILPTKNNLYKRKVVTDQLCPMCGSEAESNSHVQWRCDSARAVWGCCRGPIQKSSVEAEDFFDIFTFLCARLEDEELELFATIAHKIWSRRNRVVFGGAVLPPTILIKEATEFVEEFRKSQEATVVQGYGGQISHGRWIKPAENSIKINWDAALDSRKKIMGMGIVARDCHGEVKAAMCDIIPYIRDSTAAEAIAARRAVQFGCDMGFDSIELKGDAREIILALGNFVEADSIYGNTVLEARQRLESFHSWRISHVRREGNMAAHLLAKFAVSQPSQCVWFNYCPSVLVNVVNVELI